MRVGKLVPSGGWVLALASAGALAPSGCKLDSEPVEGGSGEAGGEAVAGRGGQAGMGGRGSVGGSQSAGRGGAAAGEGGDAGASSAGEASGAGQASNDAGAPGEAGAPGVGGGGTSGAAGASGAAGEAGSDPGCGASETQCGDRCVNLATASNDCGACGYACVHGRDCVSGRCTPAWLPLETTNAPEPRSAHAAVTVDGKFIVLGGTLTGAAAVNTSAAYDLASDEWTDLAPLNSARCGHEAVSTGAEVLTFGGLTNCSNGTTVGPGLERFAPDTGAGTWSTLTVSGAPSIRYGSSATWTGSALFVYGGGDNVLPTLATGALFTPSGPAWSDASCWLAQCDRSAGVMFVDGTAVRFLGGSYNPVYPTPPEAILDATAGLSYDLAAGTWSSWAYPTGTTEHLARRFADDGRRIYFLKATDVVTVYDRQSSSWLESDTAPMPSGFCTNAAAAWSGSELIAWSGSCSGTPTNVGGRYQPAAPAE
jgi:hypothetical protein